jgi:N-acetylglucosaminyldiphosphoundecaprenol N-acetyl-beta-D-mannosaminyltransferase
MFDKIDILGIGIAKASMAEAEAVIWNALDKNEKLIVYTPNAEMIMNAHKDKAFADVLNKGDMLVPDGIGVIHASKIMGTPLAERVGGCDLSCHIIDGLTQRGRSVYMFGSSLGVAQRAKERLEAKYNGIKIAGVSDGYFDSEKEEKIIEDINISGADILFVCLGSPKQELWIHKNKDKINAKVILGLGGTIDVLAGEKKRPPQIYITLGLEWLYYILKQPKRIKRALALPQFAITVLLKNKRSG